MEKLFIRRFFVLVIACVAFISGNNVNATKMARTHFVGLYNSAHIVAVVTIESTRITDKTQSQGHTLTSLPLIAHEAQLVKVLKSKTSQKTLSFLNTKGLRAGKKYIVFLENNNENK